MLLAAAFLGAISAPLVTMWLKPSPNPLATEHRLHASPPPTPRNLHALVGYPRLFEHYFADNFGLRTGLITLYNRLQVRMLDRSPTRKVLFGKAGWYFLQSDGGLRDYLNRSAMTEEELFAWEAALVERRDWLSARGAEYYFFIAPNKHTVYPEYYPDYFKRLGSVSRREQITNVLARRPELTALDLAPALRAAKQQSIAYRLTDTHWNEFGAYAAFRTMMAEIGSRTSVAGFPQPNHYRFDALEIPGGDLTRMAGIQDQVRETVPVVSQGLEECARKPVSREPIVPQQRFEEITYRCANGPIRVLFLSDSFGDFLAPFLAQQFQKLVQVHYQALGTDNLALLRRQFARSHYDIVIEQRVERTLGKIPGNPTLVPAP